MSYLPIYSAARISLSESIIPSPHTRSWTTSRLWSQELWGKRLLITSPLSPSFRNPEDDRQDSPKERAVSSDEIDVTVLPPTHRTTTKKSGPRTSSEPGAPELEHATPPPIEPNPPSHHIGVRFDTIAYFFWPREIYENCLEVHSER